MRRFLAIFLALAMGFCLFGCKQDLDTVNFYYLRNEITYGVSDSVIVPEAREITGRREDLNYLLGLYLMGPLDDTIHAPFPAGVRLLTSEVQGSKLVLTLSDSFGALSELELTLAAACIASTCFDLMDAQSVAICVGTGAEPVITLRRDSLTLLDQAATTPAEP